ncbi:MAG: hypothetical protein J5I90_01110 [Caldilineales bacterium]|nr:hypothetical protein [Caldilineales bacterium]
MYDSVESAITALQNHRQSEYNRTQATHYLRDHPSDEGNMALAAALDDNDYGVHWAASEALATIGEVAVPAVLHVLMQADVSHRTMSGAQHVFRANSSDLVRTESTDLVVALHDRTEKVATMQAAAALQAKLDAA